MRSTSRLQRGSRVQRQRSRSDHALSLILQLGSAADVDSAATIALTTLPKLLAVSYVDLMLLDSRFQQPPIKVHSSAQHYTSILTTATALVNQIQITKQPLIVSQLDTHLIAPLYTHSPTQALVAVPIMIDQQLVGILCAESEHPRQWLRRDVALAETVAVQLGNVLHRQHLAATVKRGADELTSFYTTTSAILAQLDLEATLHNIVEQATRLAHAHSGWLYLYDEARKELEVVTTYRCDRDYRGERVKLGEGLAGRVALSGEVARIDDYTTWTGRSDRYGPVPFHALLAVPVMHDGKLLGVLDLVHLTPGITFSDSDVSVVQLFSAQAAVAITNARLYDMLNNHAQRMSALARASQLIDAHGDIATSVKPLTLEAMQVMRAHACLLSLTDQTTATQTFYYVGLSEIQARLLQDSGAFDCRSETRALNNNAPLDDERVKAALAAGFATTVTLPLQPENRQDGCVTFFYTMPYVWTLDDIEIARVVINQIWAMLTNARLYHETHEAARLKSEFVATVSHELRTPMGAIMGYTELLMGGSYGSIPDTLHDPLSRLKANAEQLLKLINQMLDLSIIEAGRLQLHQEPLNPEDLLQATIAAVQQEALSKGLELQVVMRGSVPNIILADVARLRQILVNLLGNSIKFTRSGSVTLTCACETSATMSQLIFEVSDTGPGISNDQLALIWQPFRQVDGSATRSHNGSGLGLAIVERLTKLMGGSVNVNSTLGVGSVFSVRIPIVLPNL